MGWTVGVAFGALVLMLVWRLRSPKKGRVPRSSSQPLGTFHIQGVVEVRNDCGGPDGALPDRLLVRTTLRDDRRTRVEASTQVELESGPRELEDAPDQVGAYRIEIDWPGPRPPEFWDPPRATRVDGKEICEGVGCDPRTRCVNLASRPRRIAVSGPATEFTLRIACICVPQ